MIYSSSSLCMFYEIQSDDVGDSSNNDVYDDDKKMIIIIIIIIINIVIRFGYKTLKNKCIWLWRFISQQVFSMIRLKNSQFSWGHVSFNKQTFDLRITKQKKREKISSFIYVPDSMRRHCTECLQAFPHTNRHFYSPSM